MAYEFCIVIDKILIFQDKKGGYIGFDYSLDSQNPKILSQKDIFDLLDPLKILGRYGIRTNGEILIRGSELISHESKDIGEYFKYNKYARYSDEFRYLANGNCLFYSSENAYIVDEQKNLLQEINLPYKIDRYTNCTNAIVPSPDGYLYYLNLDRETPSYRLYRVGPYAELRMDYRPGSAMLNDSQVRLRDAPGIDGKILYKLSKGEIVRILDKGKQETINGTTSFWYKVVDWDGLEGWIFGEYLNIHE